MAEAVRLGNRTHWDGVYESKTPEAVSWYAPRLERSLEVIGQLGLPQTARIIDVGGGTSTLPRDLLEMGFHTPTVLDISGAAVAAAKEKMGGWAEHVDWVVGDVTNVQLPHHRYDLWHERAVFHFLTDQDQRDRYVEAVLRSVKPGGHIMVATFGLQGPERCSGLDLVRYDADGLHAEFGGSFEKVSSSTEIHKTPWGSEQEFLYCLCRCG